MFSKISVIGGAGFIGTSLCERFIKSDQNFEIIDLNISKKFPNYSKYGDVREIDSLREAITGDLVINLAAVHSDDVLDISLYQKTNVLGASNITKICAEKKIKKIIFTSSVAVYGFAKPDADERTILNPFNHYGKSKLEAEQIFKDWHFANLNNSLIILRPTAIFGVGNRGNIYNLFKLINSKKFIMIGNGENKKSIAYVENFSAFIEMSVNINSQCEIINYIDQPNLTMNELVSLVSMKLRGKQHSNFKLPLIIGKSLGYIADIFSTLTRLRLPISSIRLNKFVSSSEFSSSNSYYNNFNAPYTLKQALQYTLEKEFISGDKINESSLQSKN